ncbi:MAG: NUDIX domain-containing protein [Candidatus Saccharimonadales bacterium]
MSGTTNIPCVYTIIRKGDKFAFLMREHTGFLDGKYTVPAGHVEGSENFRQAAIRETFEEIGVTVRPEDLKQVFTTHRNCGDHVRVDVYFEAIAWKGEPINMEPERHAKLEWFPKDNLPYDDIMNFQAFALRAIDRGEQYGEFGWTE